MILHKTAKHANGSILRTRKPTIHVLTNGNEMDPKENVDSQQTPKEFVNFI